jgi:CRISPR/Cas system-associated exonuclease Cas4 (RecB family)
MTLLPPDFQFSQRSLQDYVDCRRRFQLRYLDQLSWPAVEAEPLIEHEHRMRSGADFHRLIQRYLLGVSGERLSKMLESRGPENNDLKRWWGNFLQFAKITPHENSLVEAPLSAQIGGYRLLAKYDLIRWEMDQSSTRVTIFDWKTSQRRPPREWLADRLQTKVYPYLLVQAGAPVIGMGELKLEQIEMVYWFADHPQEQQRFPYERKQYQQDHEYLSGLVNEIESLGDEEFFLTQDESQCKFCTYRSLCDRGIAAGLVDQAEFDGDGESEDEFDLDFDQIAEIEF